MTITVTGYDARTLQVLRLALRSARNHAQTLKGDALDDSAKARFEACANHIMDALDAIRGL